ncbi:nudix Ac38 [Cotesia congregata filamentous virus 1]|uniref:Nudix Ac38 n=1 Tax=Cotesia congregata filamentous virus 1 TaxID=3064291 RepID=A0ABC8QJK2_9VIRU|nr:nudix Ac38 [Cotesia congregata filamentous virus 1]
MNSKVFITCAPTANTSGLRAAALLYVDPDDKLFLLIRHSPYMKNQQSLEFFWEKCTLPRGGLSKNDCDFLINCAFREFLEETGHGFWGRGYLYKSPFVLRWHSGNRDWAYAVFFLKIKSGEGGTDLFDRLLWDVTAKVVVGGGGDNDPSSSIVVNLKRAPLPDRMRCSVISEISNFNLKKINFVQYKRMMNKILKNNKLITNNYYYFLTHVERLINFVYKYPSFFHTVYFTSSITSGDSM